MLYDGVAVTFIIAIQTYNTFHSLFLAILPFEFYHVTITMLPSIIQYLPARLSSLFSSFFPMLLSPFSDQKNADSIELLLSSELFLRS